MRLSSVGLSVLLTAGVAGLARAADDGVDDAPKKSESNWSKWMQPRDTWGGKHAKPTKKEAQKAHEQDALTRAKAEAEQAATLRSREEAALLRRLAVCDQLRLIASRSSDDTLLAHADELDEKARAVYASRIERIPKPKAVIVTSPKAPLKQEGDKP